MKRYKYITKPTDDELSNLWIYQNPDIAFGLEHFRHYECGVWSVIDELRVKKTILDTLEQSKCDGIRPNKAIISSVLEIAKIKTAVDDKLWDANPSLLVMENGAFDLSELRLRSHSPKDYVSYALPYPYLPDAKAPALEQYMSCLPLDLSKIIQEFLGLCMTKEIKYETAFFLVGDPGGGKSTLLLIAELLTGPRSMHLGLRDCQKSRFGLGNIQGKTLAISDEQPEGNITDTDLLKAMISGEMVLYEEKFCNPVYIRSTLKMLMAMNNLPQLPSGNDGLIRRIKVLRMPPIPPERRDRDLKAKLRQEGSGIFNFALEGLIRLNTQGKFSDSQSVEVDSLKYQHSYDIPALFMKERCLLVEDGKVQSEQLHNCYRAWCVENGYKPISSKALAGELERLGLERKRIDGRSYWMGVKLKSD